MPRKGNLLQRLPASRQMTRLDYGNNIQQKVVEAGKKMYNPITDHVVSVKSDQFQKYLDLGYHFGSRHRKVKPNNE